MFNFVKKEKEAIDKGFNWAAVKCVKEAIEFCLNAMKAVVLFLIALLLFGIKLLNDLIEKMFLMIMLFIKKVCFW